MPDIDYYIALNHDVELDPETPFETWGVDNSDYEATLSGDPVMLGYDPDGNPLYRITLNQSVDSTRHFTQVNTVCPVVSSCPDGAECSVNGGESQSIYGINVL